MYLLGCDCGREQGSEGTREERQKECFSYVVSVDGVHVCHPVDIVEYESDGEDGIDGDVPNGGEEERTEGEQCESDLDSRVVECESAGEDDIDGDLQTVVELESTGGGKSEGGTETHVVHENAAEDDPQSDQLAIVKSKGTEVAASERQRPDTLLQRRGRSLCRIRLARSTSTQATLVSFSNPRSEKSSLIKNPHPQSGTHEYIKQIGIDGEGIIHLMRNRKTHQLIARKTVAYARSLYAKPIEAAILQDVFPTPHRNIIQLHASEPYQALDSDRADGARYYFEYCAGGDLHLLVDQYRRRGLLLPEPFLWQVYHQLASALEYLHRGFDIRRNDPQRRGVCHRDIKPSNVFLRPGTTPGSSYPDAVLADFGHATLNFATYDPAGTTIWQPPELPRHSPKGDVYALGAVMHFLIHFEAPIARLPEGAGSSSSVKEAWAAAPEARRPLLEFVDGYSDELICMMLIALEADENKRKNSHQLLKMLEEVIERKFPPGSDLQQSGEEWPLMNWAFDHMMRVREGGDEEDERVTGAEQYFEMMERFGTCSSRESSTVSSPFPSDWRRRPIGRSSRGRETSADSSLGEEY